MSSSEEAFSNQRIGWCCADRLSRQRYPGIWIISGQITVFCAVIRPQSAARTNEWRILQPIERTSPSVKSTIQDAGDNV
jgi:hypothetical protein